MTIVNMQKNIKNMRMNLCQNLIRIRNIFFQKYKNVNDYN